MSAASTVFRQRRGVVARLSKRGCTVVALMPELAPAEQFFEANVDSADFGQHLANVRSRPK